jgi:hypothetical protein
MPEFCLESCFPFVSFLDSYIVVPLMYVHFGKYVGTAQIGDELHNEREWVLISHRVAVKPPIILYWS